ncbi:YkgG family uncharacterized protein [Natranaerovirga pectinivora]|uniref:YkgG family uncharacterized protein n=1 Tax=Natranaerovirga pectinivora TaxID=682400 RepID=A0A4R3MSW3_9FIRM|nr:lactate utilization protein [Natranaerovirga pectinivora]TCT16800.1 YkgG family uncharacterized protein [Natranaerovirga pectinivora]
MLGKKLHYQNVSKTLIRNFEKRNITACYCDTKEDALEKALSFINEGDLISYGGSVSLNEIGLIDEIDTAKYNILSKNKAKTKEEKDKVYKDAFHADVYFMSSNAITLDGQLVNIDGYGNRVAALIYGPKKVVLVVGMNKLTTNVDDAIRRVHNIASPPNTIRLNINTPCSKTGKCENCLTESCICCAVVTTRYSREKDRIHVILVGEELGY